MSLTSQKPSRRAASLARLARAQEGLCAGEMPRRRDTAGDGILARLPQGRVLSEGSSWAWVGKGRCFFLLVQSYWEAGGSDLSRTAAARDMGTLGTPQRLRFFSFCGFCMNPSGSSPPFWQDGCWGTHQPQRFFGSRWDAVCTLAATKAWLLFGQEHHPRKARDFLSI